MFRVLNCVATEHDFRLVVLAAVICAIAAFTSFRIYARATGACAPTDRQYRRVAWLGLTGLSTGAGIWATHFVAMLAYHSGFPTAYDPTLTLVSLVIAIGVTTAGYLVSVEWRDPAGVQHRFRLAVPASILPQRADVRAAACGAIVGAGIGAMHYTGMAAVIVPGAIHWNTPYVAASVLLGILLASAAMVANRRLAPRYALWAAPGLLTLAICSLHFTAMAAATVVPDPTIIVQPSVINTLGMAFAVAGVTLLVMLAAIGAALVNAQAERDKEKELRRHNEILQQRDRELAHQNAQLAHQHALLKQHEGRLQAQNLRLDAALNNMVQGLAMFDPEHRLVIANPRFAEIYGLAPEEATPGTSLKQIIEYRIAKGYLAGRNADDVLKPILSRSSGQDPEQYTGSLHDGRWITVSVQPMADGGTVTTHHDVTEQRRFEAKIAHMALHDALTGLPNRVLLNERLEYALARVKGSGDIVAVHLLDLDLFKNVNDTLGHPAGDKLLKMVAARLRSRVSETDTVARMGGDEFAIVQTAISKPVHATTLALRIIDAVSEPYEVEGQEVIIGTSVGIAVGPADGFVPDQLVRNADLALYRTKSDGRGTYRFFEPEMGAQMQARRGIEHDLRRALVQGEFELHYQPAVRLTDNKIIGFEALIRWRHPQKGMIAPDQFIPVAEGNGIIIPLGEWALRQACAAAARWPEHTKIAVNLSPVQFRSAGLVQTVMSALAASHLTPQRLELEITETTLMQESQATLCMLFQLRELGVRIALDDFGTGYSSLSHLQSFPFDRIKIDRSFISDIEGVGSLNIVRAVSALAKGLGMETTAEGVETQQQLDAVKSEGCSEMQGFLFSRPRPAHEIEQAYFADVAEDAALAGAKLRLSA